MARAVRLQRSGVPVTSLLRLLLPLVLLLWSLFGSSSFILVVAAPSAPRSPYAVLGVSREATQEDVKRRYRQLCLKYHPDKQRHLPASEQKEYERLFKELQAAYSEIGTPQARRQYDLSERTSNLFGSSSNNNNGFHSNRKSGSTSQPPFNNHNDARQAFEAAFRAFPSSRNNGAPNFYGFNVNEMFRNNGSQRSPFGFGSDSPLWNPSLKSIYVQKVSVSLKDLYTGQPDYQIQLHDNILQRTAAAFRGGIGYLILYQSILYALPLIRVSAKVATVLGLWLFQHHLPRITTTTRNFPWRSSLSENNNNHSVFTVNLRAGYKGGTKFIFNESQTKTPGVQVHFVVTEARHERYRRVGHQLHVTCAISRHEAATGCDVEIPSLADEDYFLRVEIPAGSRHGDVLTFPGKGWPNRRQPGSKGDLLVTIAVRPWLRR